MTLKIICGKFSNSHELKSVVHDVTIDHMTLLFSKSSVTLPVCSNNNRLYSAVSSPIPSASLTKSVKFLVSLLTWRCDKIWVTCNAFNSSPVADFICLSFNSSAWLPKVNDADMKSRRCSIFFLSALTELGCGLPKRSIHW